MKALFFLLFLVILSVSVNAQKDSTFNQNASLLAKENLKHDLKKAQDMKFYSSILILAGSATAITGMVRNFKIPDNKYYTQEGEDAREKNLKIILVGAGITTGGIALHRFAKDKERKLETTLIMQGSASNKTIGLNIRF